MRVTDFFSSRKKESTPERSERGALLERLTETEQHPLKRIPAADLAGEWRDIAERINARLDAVAAAEKEQQ